MVRRGLLDQMGTKDLYDDDGSCTVRIVMGKFKVSKMLQTVGYRRSDLPYRVSSKRVEIWINDEYWRNIKSP